MSERTLRFVIRTPHEVVLNIDARSIRIPTESGHVGLRPRNEPQIIAVEAGLVLIHAGAAVLFAGTAGGVLVTGRSSVTLMTPLAVTGSDREAIMTQLQTALGEPNEEMQARAMLANLEEEILSEMRRKPGERPHEGVSR